jgi:hypothetical protein
MKRAFLSFLHELARLFTIKLTKGYTLAVELKPVFLVQLVVATRPQFMVERLDPPLSQEMGGAYRPLHPLLLAETFAHDLVRGRLHKVGADPSPVAIALAIVGRKTLIILDIGSVTGSLQPGAKSQLTPGYSWYTRGAFPP